MKSLLGILLIVIISCLLIAQTVNLKGVVLDDATGLPIEDVNIIVSESQPNFATDHSGNFELNLEVDGKYQITFSRIGYQSLRFDFDPLNIDLLLEIRLKPTEITIGEVTVTSTRYSKLEKDIALPLEVVSSEKLEKNLAITVPDILNNEPGITLVRDGIWSTDINIRGLSRQNVVTLVDGNRIETSTNLAAGLSLIDMFDIQRIEVIKGGVSSLYGTGSTGGVINIITKKPSYTDDFHLSGTLSSGYNSVNDGGIGSLSLTTASDNWFAKVSASLRSAINTNTPQGRLPNSQFRDNYFSGSAGIIPVDNHEIRLSYQNFSGEDIGIPGGKTFPQNAVARYLIAKREMYSAEYRINNLIPSLVNTSIKYFYQGIERNVEIKPNPTTTTLPRANHNTNGIQLQTNWLLDNHNQLAAGIDFWQRKYNGFRETIVKTGTTIKITADSPVPNSKYLSAGVFAQNESRLVENKLVVTVGGRFDLIKVTNDEVQNPAYIITNGITTYPPANPLASFSAGKYNDQSWSGNIGLLFPLTKSIELTLNLAHAFRSPVLEERFQYINLGGNIYLGNPNLKSERGNFIDAGFRIWNDDISLKSNIFYNSFNNLVIDKPIIVDSLYQKDNVGKARLYGFDLGMEYNLFSNMIFYASASFVRGEDTESKTDLPQIPPFNGRIGFKISMLKYVSVEIASTFFAKQNKVAFGETKTPGYVLFDLYLSSMPFDFDFMNFKLFTGVENLLNQEYRNHLSTNRGSIQSEPGRNFFIRTNFIF
jgi:hemoglobin/transferrin/lactoferrin receptor protein